MLMFNDLTTHLTKGWKRGNNLEFIVIMFSYSRLEKALDIVRET